MLKIFNSCIAVLLIFLAYIIPLAKAEEMNLNQKLHAELIGYKNVLISLSDVFKEYQNNSGVFVDIRSNRVYEKGHIPNSINLNLPVLPQTILENPNILPKNKPIYIICCAEDRNAMFALLPLRMAGYDAYAVTGGGVDAWKYLQLPLEYGSEKFKQNHWQTELTLKQKQSLMKINPDYHMMSIGRSYIISLDTLKEAIEKDNVFVIGLNIDNIDSKTYVNQVTTLADLPLATWLKNLKKNEPIVLIGSDDKELVLGLIALRMLGFNALIAI